jgi:hypothetical protein
MVFACIVRFRLPADAASRSRAMANFAIAAPVVWGVAITVLIAYSRSQV